VVLELLLAPVGGDQRLPKPADLAGAVVGGDLDEPLPESLSSYLCK
jgi:hypothetical protein